MEPVKQDWFTADKRVIFFKFYFVLLVVLYTISSFFFTFEVQVYIVVPWGKRRLKKRKRKKRRAVYIIIYIYWANFFFANLQLQALVYDILPSTIAVFSYAIGPRKLSANKQFFVGAQTVVCLLQTTQIISDI